MEHGRNANIHYIITILRKTVIEIRGKPVSLLTEYLDWSDRSELERLDELVVRIDTKSFSPSDI